MMLTDKEIEKILRDDLRHTRKCVEESLAVLLEIADDRDDVARERLDLDASRHSMACAKALAAIGRWNRFCVSGTVPEDLAMKTKAAGAE
jgi:hypothetical protein